MSRVGLGVGSRLESSAAGRSASAPCRCIAGSGWRCPSELRISWIC